jgi:hypothetical protein
MIRMPEPTDGIMAIIGTGEDCGIRVDGMVEIRDYVKGNRNIGNPFDIVIIHWSEGRKVASEMEELQAFSDAGLTWWLEDLS